MTHVGTTTILKEGTVTNVLHVPEFKFNLLAVSKLTNELSCSVNFFPDFCIFQDLHSGRVKGIGREEDGLYVLKVNKVSSKEKEAISAAATYGNEEAYKLWHMRLGHPSQAILSSLSNNDFNFKISF